jgi:hypothetical protein
MLVLQHNDLHHIVIEVRLIHVRVANASLACPLLGHEPRKARPYAWRETVVIRMALLKNADASVVLLLTPWLTQYIVLVFPGGQRFNHCRQDFTRR